MLTAENQMKSEQFLFYSSHAIFFYAGMMFISDDLARRYLFWFRDTYFSHSVVYDTMKYVN